MGNKVKNQKPTRAIPIYAPPNYASEYSDLSFQLKQTFDELLKSNGLKLILDDTETPLI